MKPAPFAYVRAASLDEVHTLLAEHGDEARLLAGGQSLVPMLNMRVAAPRLVIDINHLAGLDRIEAADGHVRVGALVRHADLERSDEVARKLPLIARAIPHIAHPAIRNMGTIGGSLALADPAAELPACAVALDARIVLSGPSGERRVPAQEFFRGLYETAIDAGEVLTAVEFATGNDGARSSLVELSRRHGDYAIVGVAAHGHLEGGALSGLRLVYFGVGDRPVLAPTAASAAEGRTPLSDAIAAAQAALGDDLDPVADMNASAAMKLHLARVLTEQALTELATV